MDHQGRIQRGGLGGQDPPSGWRVLYEYIGGFEFALDGMLNVRASDVNDRKSAVTLRKFNVPHPFVGKITSCSVLSSQAGERSHLNLKMVNNCCVVGCTNYVGKKPGLRFYSFPSDTQRREKWVAAVRRKDWQPSKYTRICNEHFITGKLPACTFFIILIYLGL